MPEGEGCIISKSADRHGRQTSFGSHKVPRLSSRVCPGSTVRLWTSHLRCACRLLPEARGCRGRLRSPAGGWCLLRHQTSERHAHTTTPATLCHIRRRQVRRCSMLQRRGDVLLEPRQEIASFSNIRDAPCGKFEESKTLQSAVFWDNQDGSRGSGLCTRTPGRAACVVTRAAATITTPG